MSSNYNQIRKDNIKEYGEGTRHLAFFDRLYSDRTHFIFELLQNAEDAGAKKIRFGLFQNRLEIMHDGRLFNEKDVRGVCGVGESTKSDDLTQIGKFGIGFKSVYAFTLSPEIHCGDEHFKIESYVRPYLIESKTAIDASWTTLFIIPFDRADIPASTAFHEIGNRLKSLNVYTLLFLRNIEEIAWHIENESEGVYLREIEKNENYRRVSLLGQDGNEIEEDWLVFERPIKLHEINRSVCVEVAYKIVTDEKGTQHIEKVLESPLIVFFPTDKQTHLGFLIQGPYRTTPARDNIPPNDEWNKRLVQETAELVVDSLFIIKELGLLNVTFLQTLPIRSENFRVDSMFRPVYDTIRAAFLKQPLLPTQDGFFVPAYQAKIAESKDLRNLLSSENLQIILNNDTYSDVRWLHENITNRNTVDYLKNELKIEEITSESFVRKITSKFIEIQTDEWIIKFYSYLIDDRESLWRRPHWNGDKSEILRYNRPIIRLNNGKHISPFNKTETGELPNACIPSGDETDFDFPIVKIEIAQNKQALEFLKKVGLTEPDVVDEVIDKILPAYTTGNNISDEDHKRDIFKIFKALKINSEEKKQRLIVAIKNTSCLYAVNAGTGEQRLKKSIEIYFQSPQLNEYFSNNSSAWLLDSRYHPDIDELYSLLNIHGKPKLSHENPNYANHVIITKFRGRHERGIDGFDPDCSMDGIEHVLKSISRSKSAYIWNNSLKFSKYIKGKIESSSRQNFKESKIHQAFSKFGNLLINNAWLPDRNGNFHIPSELSLSDLPDEFETESIESRKLAEILGLKKDIEQEFLSQLPEEKRKKIELIEQIPLEKLEELATSLKRPSFPEKSVSNPERRSRKVEEYVQSAIPKESEIRKRAVRISEHEAKELAKTSLRILYTNDNDQMICQICKQEMPFKYSNGDYYFETVQCIRNVGYEYDVNYLALCPTCSAKYRCVRETDDENIKKRFVNDGELEIPVILAGKNETIQFVEQHFHDLKIVLKNE
ncbi:MAG: sacsin N-terminal ATP-binding-like domain-containing protein [Desulfococcaceae bacterium]